jgi:hypothetical protein
MYLFIDFNFLSLWFFSSARAVTFSRITLISPLHSSFVRELWNWIVLYVIRECSLHFLVKKEIWDKRNIAIRTAQSPISVNGSFISHLTHSLSSFSLCVFWCVRERGEATASWPTVENLQLSLFLVSLPPLHFLTISLQWRQWRLPNPSEWTQLTQIYSWNASFDLISVI